MNLKQLLKEEREMLPIGYFLVTNACRISPGGGWVILLDKNNILRVDYDEKLYRWNALKNDWVNVHPPISGTDDFKLSRYGGARNMLQTFLQNTKSITKGQAEKLQKEAVAEKTLKVKEAAAFLATLDKNQMIKIVIVA